MDLQLAEWLRVVRSDYLEEFIAGGGAAVKFVVPATSESRRAVLNGLRDVATAAGCHFASVDASRTRIHMVDKLFFEVASQIHWDELTDGFLRRLLAERAYRIPAEGALRFVDIAALNGVAPADLPEFEITVRRLLTEHLYHDYSLAHEFRFAMMRLCEARLLPGGARSDEADLITLWLRGELRSVSALKSARIFRKITRDNARHMLSSLAEWMHLSGATGLVLCLDINRYTESVRPPESSDGLWYSTAATLDVYEVLRQFIDATDELRHCFVAVLATRAFLDDPRRGLERYDALRLRIWDEVHDRRRPNPLAALVRMAGVGERAGGNEEARR
jgi:hypothetical protein